MIHLSVFCPFERIFTLFWKLVTVKELDALELDIPGFPLFKMSVTEAFLKEKQQGLGISEVYREKFFLEKPPLAMLRCYRGDEMTEKVLHLYHDLLTSARQDSPADDVKAENSDGLASYRNGHFLADGLECRYPEAYKTVLGGVALRASETAPVADTFRTFFNFILAGVRDDGYEIHCPDFVYRNVASWYMTIQANDGRVYQVYTESPADPALRIPQRGVAEIQRESSAIRDVLFDSCVPHLRVLRDDQEQMLVPLLPGLLKRDVLGARMTPAEFLNALKIVAHAELYEGVDVARSLVIDCQIRSGHIYMTEERTKFLQLNCDTNPMIMRRMSSLIPTSELLLQEIQPNMSVPLYGEQLFEPLCALVALFCATTNFCVADLAGFATDICASGFLSFDWGKRTYAITNAARSGVAVARGMNVGTFRYVDHPEACDDAFYIAVLGLPNAVQRFVVVADSGVGDAFVVFDPADALTGQKLEPALVRAVITVDVPAHTRHVQIGDNLNNGGDK